MSNPELTEDAAYANSDFRTSNRKRLLRGLFFETCLSPDKASVLYTLKQEDHLGYPSLYRLYLEAGDPTEYSFACLYLESYDHWEMLCECVWFKPYLAKWRKDLEMKIKSEALARIMAEARNDKSPSKFTANKFILEKGWEPKDGQSKRGRPSKDEIAKAAVQHLEADRQLIEDMSRIRVN